MSKRKERIKRRKELRKAGLELGGIYHHKTLSGGPSGSMLYEEGDFDQILNLKKHYDEANGDSK